MKGNKDITMFLTPYKITENVTKNCWIREEKYETPEEKCKWNTIKQKQNKYRDKIMIRK